MNRNIKIKVGVPPIWIVKSNVGPLIIVSSPTILYFNFFLDTALKHKIVMQSQTISDGSGKLNLVHVSRSTQNCLRQFAITTSLCEQDRRLFAAILCELAHYVCILIKTFIK